MELKAHRFRKHPSYLATLETQSTKAKVALKRELRDHRARAQQGTPGLVE